MLSADVFTTKQNLKKIPLRVDGKSKEFCQNDLIFEDFFWSCGTYIFGTNVILIELMVQFCSNLKLTA